MRALVALTLFAGLLFGGGTASARERLAVFVGVDGDPALSENLSEVIIAKLADSAEFELVGARELEVVTRDVPIVKAQGLGVCVELPACVAEMGARVRATRAVLGKVRPGGAAYSVELALVRVDTFHTERRKAEDVPADLGALIAAIQAATGELFHPESPPVAAPPAVAAAGVAATPREPAVASAATRPNPRATGDSPSARAGATPWLRYVAFAAAGLAVVAFSAAAVTGAAASSPPSGSTRKQRKEDIEHKQEQAKAANVFLASGGAMSAAAIVAFAWP